jgi:Homeodomain-like domain
VLLAADGKTDLQIAASLNISNQKAARWRKRFLRLDLAGLVKGRTPSWAETRDRRPTLGGN